MQSKKLAIISDIHGNSWGFSEVLRDIKNREIETIINLGDTLHGPLDPKGTFELLLDHEIISISGNQDRAILENLDGTTDSSTTEFVVNSMDNRMTDWLKQLPFDFIYDDLIYCCHAGPERDTIPVLEDIQPNLVTIKDTDELDEILSDINQRVVVYGHTHVPRLVVNGNKTIINPGSVGLPAYDDDSPVFHRMESFTPHARYSVLTFSNSLVDVNQIAVSYDYETAAAVAEKNKRPDWAKWIRTGRA